MRRFKTFTAPVLFVLGILIIVQTVRYTGVRIEAWTGLTLGAAMIVLAIVRIRDWRRRA